MIGKIRHDPGKGFILDGYPEGSALTGIVGVSADELARLSVFGSDLKHVVGWLREVQSDDERHLIREATTIAALVKFCSCFESTSGLRQLPLKPSKIYNPSDRSLIEELRLIRNKAVAHDEQLFPANSVMVVFGPNANPIEAVCLAMRFPIHGMTELSELPRLAEQALDWVGDEIERVCSEIITQMKSVSLAERRKIVEESQPYKIDIVSKSIREVIRK
jgi:hypothetical protein